MATGQRTGDGGLTSTLQAFTSGFVDTLGFVALFGLFTAHVTGNFVLIGASVSTGNAGVIGKLLALPVFVIGVACTRLYVLRLNRRKRDAAAPLTMIEHVLLVAFMLAGAWAQPFGHPDGMATILVSMLGVATMTVQNAASRLAFASLGPTTVMTGNVTQLAIDLVDLLSGNATPETAARLRKTWPPVLAFAVGAIAGGIGYRVGGFWSLLIPVAALTMILLRLRPSSSPSVA